MDSFQELFKLSTCISYFIIKESEVLLGFYKHHPVITQLVNGSNETTVKDRLLVEEGRETWNIITAVLGPETAITCCLRNLIHESHLTFFPSLL